MKYQNPCIKNSAKNLLDYLILFPLLIIPNVLCLFFKNIDNKINFVQFYASTLPYKEK